MGVKETHDLTTSASISRFLVVCLVLLRYNIEVQVSKAPACGSFWKLIYEGNFLYHQIPYPLKIQDSHDVFPKKNRTQKRTHLTDPMGGWINYAEPLLSHQKRMDWLVFCQVYTMSQPFSVVIVIAKNTNKKSYGGVTFSKISLNFWWYLPKVWGVKLTQNWGSFFGASKKASHVIVKVWVGLLGDLGRSVGETLGPWSALFLFQLKKMVVFSTWKG